MTNDYRPISDKVNDTAPTPTIGAFIQETLDMQAETLMIICKIVSIIWGDEDTPPAISSKENVMSGLAAIQENQRVILMAVKDIMNKL